MKDQCEYRPDLCDIRPNVGQPRCKEHHADSWWPGNKRCDKTLGHRGKHISFHRSPLGIDETAFVIWALPGEAGQYYG